MPFKEISLKPELSSPPLLESSGGYPECYERANKGWWKEILFCLVMFFIIIIS